MTRKWLILGAISFSVGFSLNFVLDRDIKRAALTGLITIPATAAGVSIIDLQRKRQIGGKLPFVQNQVEELETQKTELKQCLSQLQTETENLKQQEATLQQAISTALAQKQQIETALADLQTEVLKQENRKKDLDQALLTVEHQVQNLETESYLLKTQLQNLKNQEIELNRSLAATSQEKQYVENSLDSCHSELNQLQTEIADWQQQKTVLEQDLLELKTQSCLLTAESTNLQTRIQELQQQESLLKQSLEYLAKEKQRVAQTSLPQQLTQKFQNGKTNLNSNFMNAKYTRKLWEDKILPYWSHRERPAGQRFLGSIRIQRNASEELLDIVGQNLKRLDRVTYTSLYEEFYELEQNWLKVITFALSEYAYYYSSEKFWQGFCDRLDIHHNQGVENTLRQIVDEGIELLGLIRAKGGYKYVSTLWLQSGVPEQNLGHFAQLVQELADEYGWWELSHTPAEDLSQLLLNFCQEKHPQWGTLINFLKSSYSEDEEVEFISGQLLQGIAIIAQELERQQASPQALQDENQREELLGNYYLPQNFFLRNWSALIRVLTPRTGSARTQKIISRRSKPLILSLDVTDSLNTQLVLPKQTIWKPAWRNLRGTYCQIPEANWENIIPSYGDLEIPELVIDVNQIAENWNCQLLDHNRQSLLHWYYKGITNQLPCLIFDAITGNHLPLYLPNPIIIGSEEIIYFTPKEIESELANGIELLDSCIPSSLRGWRGWQIRLTTPESSIMLNLPETAQSQIICWKLAENEQPILRGLRLKGKKSVYLEVPEFWYPPLNQALTLNVLIENITERTIICRILKNLLPNKRWSAIPLNQWITEPGCYEARFWFESRQWCYRFEVQSHYQLTAFTEINPLKICSDSGFSQADLPIKYDAIEKFWAERIKFEGLWPLEEVILFLADGNERISYQCQADRSGILVINLAALHNLLPESNCYALDYQRFGLEPQRLLEIDILPDNITWNWANQAIHVSGLQHDKSYILSCWNLLLPDKKPEEIQFSSIEQNPSATTVHLSLPPGIYQIQLFSPQQLPKLLGLWCGSGQYDLPEESNHNEDLANYCYTILGNNESIEELLDAVKKLNLDLNRIHLKSLIENLENHQYHFPDWLDGKILKTKLNKLLESLNPSSKKVVKDSLKIEKLSVVKHSKGQHSQMVEKGNWYLATVRSQKRNLFLKTLDNALKANQVQEVILEIQTPKDSVYKDMVLLRLSNYKTALTHLQTLEYFQAIERRPLSREQVDRMLGAK